MKKGFLYKLLVSGKNRMVIIIMLTMVIILAFLHLSLYMLMRDSLEQKFVNNVQGVASATAKGIQDDVVRYIEFLELVEVLIDAGQDITEECLRQNEYYMEKNSYFASIKEAGALEFVYTVRFVEEKNIFHFVLDGEAIGSEYWSSPGDEDDWDEGKELIYSFVDENGIYLGPSAISYGVIDFSEWGELIVAYAPILDYQGRIVGLVGADVSAAELYDYLARFQVVMFSVCALLLIVLWLLVRHFSNVVKQTHERLLLMLDTSPICAQIWARDLSTIDCNLAGVKLYRFKDKQEYIERFIAECSPEFQPDGRSSAEKAVAFVHQAFEEGYSRFDWIHRIPDTDENFPADIILVRAKYKNDDVVIGYTRDLREQQKMMESIENRDKMLQAVNRASVMLLTTQEGENIDDTVMRSMELVGNSTGVDRIYIWRSEKEGEIYRHTCVCGWDSELGKKKLPIPMGMNFSASEIGVDWDVKFLENECINGCASTMAQNEQLFLSRFDIKSVAVIPMFIDDQLWGVLCIGNCEHERILKDDEIAIMRSLSLMMASAINRHALVEKRTRELALQTTTLTTLFDSLPNLIYTKDKNLNFIHCNRSMLEHFGVEVQDVIGKNEKALNMPYELEKTNQTSDFEILNNGSIIAYEKQIPRIDGTNPFYEITKIPLELGGEVVGIISMAHDITERKQREREIAVQLEYTQKLNDALSKITKSPTISAGDLKAAADVISQNACIVLNATRVAVWVINEDSTALENISSYVFSINEHSIQEDFDLVRYSKYARLMETERLIVMNSYDECQQTIDDNDERFCGRLDTPIRVDGKLSGAICIEQFVCPQYPISRKWTIEEQSFVTSLSDIMAVAVSNAQRNTARDEARSASQAKSDFLANMSHEIRTPLNVIVGLTELMMDGDSPPEEPMEYLQKINTAGVTLVGLINDILDISKIEARKFTLTPAQYELASLLNDVVTLNIARIGSKPITFSLEINNDLYAKLYGDDLRLKQIVSNVLGNAFKYTRWGSVSLSVVCTPLKQNQVMLSFIIKDTGIGMRPEDIQKLFKDYNQVDTQANRMIEGTGLGLSISKGLVELMDGKITVQSEYGKGSTFIVNVKQGYISDELIDAETVEHLKKFRYEDDKGKASKKLVRPDLSWAKVLVVDDSPTNLDVAKGLLGKYKMKIDCVLNGQGALDRIRLAQPVYDAIFMDHMMPGMDGVETTKLIRNHPSEYARTIPIIALTANAVAGSEQMFLDEGFQAFVSKPIKIKKLDNVIRKWIMKESEQIACVNEPVNEPVPQVIEVEPALSAQIPGINMKLGLSLYEDDMDMLIEVMRSYSENVPSELERMKGVNEENLPQYAIDIHTMKGASSSIGAKDLMLRAKKMERMAKSGDLAGVLELNEQFIEDASALVANIKKWLQMR
jgi:PAS domain S-box-containing protein